MFSKKKKKPQISPPTNFEHRVHTGFDKREGKYVGLPLQWASIVGNNQILKSTNRPLPLVDPSEITPTEILDLKTIVRGDHKMEHKQSMPQVAPNKTNNAANGLMLPKTSNVARSNSLRSSSPPRLRRDHRSNANVPPAVPEEQIMQYPSLRREANIGKPQVHDNPVHPAPQTHETVPLNHVNGNIPEPGPYAGYPVRDQQQISPVGSVASTVPSVGLSQLGGHTHSHLGSHQNLTHPTYPHGNVRPPSHPSPDQNQNVKTPGGGQGQVGALTASTASSAKQHHEQRLTHEQVNIILLAVWSPHGDCTACRIVSKLAFKNIVSMFSFSMTISSVFMI